MTPRARCVPIAVMSHDPERLRRIEAALTYPEKVEPSLGQRRLMLRLSSVSSMRSDACAWAIVGAELRRREAPPTAIVREVRYLRGTEGRLEVRDVEIDEALAKAWCREAAAIRVPLIDVEARMGVDGSTSTLYAESGFSSVKLSWWCDGPSEWRPLTQWAEQLMTRLEAVTADITPTVL
ncbi:hypothetical protein A7982_12176 [Minicystis rosea]|nr:hypothetical protein A7982_12176 [Minicystis rosea]